jgi:hypothetical protein
MSLNNVKLAVRGIADPVPFYVLSTLYFKRTDRHLPDSIVHQAVFAIVMEVLSAS